MKAQKHGKDMVISYNGLQEFKNTILGYEFKREYNSDKFKSESEDVNYKFHGTDNVEDCKNLATYIYPERLQQVQQRVSDAVQNIAVQDVRRRVKFAKHGELVTDRYFAGDKKRPFATRGKRKSATVPTVNIYITAGYNAGTDAHNEAPYNALAGVVFAQKLASKGFAVNIYSIVISESSGKNTIFRTKIKDSKEYLDSDTLAILASDPRFFRYYGFLGIIHAYDLQDRDVPYGLGRAPSEQKQNELINKYFDDVDFIFGNTFNESKAVNQLKQSIEIINQKY